MVQLAVLRTTADHLPPCSLTRSESPAQLGHAMMSPERVPSGSSISCPHPLHWTLTIPTSDRAVTEPSAQVQQPHQLAAVEADDGLAVDHGDWGRPIAERLKLVEGRRVIPDVLVHERDPLLRKKLFLLVACPSSRLAVDDDVFCHQLSPFSFPASDLRRTSPITSSPANTAKSGKRI